MYWWPWPTSIAEKDIQTVRLVTSPASIHEMTRVLDDRQRKDASHQSLYSERGGVHANASHGSELIEEGTGCPH